MIIYPAIDLKGGSCVRLIQGKQDATTVYSSTPGQVAAAFQAQGAQYLHVVDLDGAFAGHPVNLKAIEEIAANIEIPFQVGGGLRNRRDVERIFDLGAKRVIIGTRAVSSPEFIIELLAFYGPERIILGLDAKEGMVAVEGWTEKSQWLAVEFGKKMRELGIETAVYTDVSRDGLLQGPNLSSIREMAQSSGLCIIASGGVSSIEDIVELKAMGPLGVSGAIIGKALYEGKINLEQALALITEAS